MGPGLAYIVVLLLIMGLAFFLGATASIPEWVSLAPGVVVGALYLVAWLSERDAPQGYGQGGLVAVVGTFVTGSLLVSAVVGWRFRARRLPSWPLMATATCLLALWLWRELLDALPCGDKQGWIAVPTALVVVAAAGEAAAASRRGRGPVTVLAWTLGAGTVVVAGALAAILTHAGSAACFS